MKFKNNIILILDNNIRGFTIFYFYKNIYYNDKYKYIIYKIIL